MNMNQFKDAREIMGVWFQSSLRSARGPARAAGSFLVRHLSQKRRPHKSVTAAASDRCSPSSSCVMTDNNNSSSTGNSDAAAATSEGPGPGDTRQPIEGRKYFPTRRALEWDSLDMYRMYHVVRDRGVGLLWFGCATRLPSCLANSAKLPLAQTDLGRHWNMQNES